MKNYEIKIKELENGNGYIYNTVINGCECDHRVWNHHGDQIGLKTEGEAIMAAAGVIKHSIEEQERYDQHKAAVLLEQM